MTECTKKGVEVLRDGSPEWLVLQLLPEDGRELERESAEKELGPEVFKAGHGICAKNKWITATKNTLARAKTVVLPSSDLVREQLRAVHEGRPDDSVVPELKKRTLVASVTYKSMELHKGPHFSVNGPRDLARDLTHEMLLDDSWKTASFKTLNKEALGLVPDW